MIKKVIVIGGGVGGLCGAIRLAKLGFDVHLYEKNEHLGGKMGQIKQNGFTFDTGPTLVTMPFVIEDLFNFVDSDINQYIKLVPIDPICRYFFKGKKPFDASSCFETMQNNIKEVFNAETENYSNFLKYTKSIYKHTADVFIFSPIHEVQKILTWRHLPKLFTLYQIDPFRTVHQSVKRFFTDPHLIQLFDRYPTYNGSDPYRAPATLNVIPYVELGLGGFYIDGGLYRLTESLEKIAKQLNITINKGIRVEQLIHSNKRVKGISVQGEKLDADVILCNSDVVVTHNKLLKDFSKTTKRLNSLEPSLSGMTFFWGVEGQYPQLKQHNIIFSEDYKNEFKQIFNEFSTPTDPTIYISISSKHDKNHAPLGFENWFVLINMPYLNNNQCWDSALIDQIRLKVVEKLKRFGIDIEGKIKSETTMTPLDIANYYESNQGSIYGISSNTMNSAFKRPANRSHQLRGLYFTGGSTHPGGGVPMCMLSSKIAADLIDEYER